MSDRAETAGVGVLLAAIRDRQPLVHHITNWVTIAECAQAVKSLGGSPVMAHAPQEAAEMAALASALVLNIGTLTEEVVDAMVLAARAANGKGIPVVLDACGAGATGFRDLACRRILEAARIDIVKGNASEVARVAGLEVRTRGVDAAAVAGDVADIARRLAAARGSTVAVTGKVDIVAGAGRTYRVSNGHEMMARVVGTGCMAASVIGTFAAVLPGDLPRAAAAALACHGIAGEVAAAAGAGPGTFKGHLLDALAALDGKKAEAMARITVE